MPAAPDCRPARLWPEAMDARAWDGMQPQFEPLPIWEAQCDCGAMVRRWGEKCRECQEGINGQP